MKTLQLLGGSVVLGTVLLAPVAVLADGPQATATAAQHAGLAANQAELGGVQTHLHHALNCLVGQGGQGFDAAKGNPCAQAGGAIPQTTDAAMKEKLEKAATQVRTALGSTDVAAAKKAATEVAAALKPQ